MPEAEAPPTATIATFFPGISGGTYMDIYIYKHLIHAYIYICININIYIHTSFLLIQIS